MSEISLVFPNALFENNPAIKPGRPVILVEEFLFFRQYNFHKQKLLLHRASMKFYESFLQQKEIHTEYIDTNNRFSDVRLLPELLHNKGTTEIFLPEINDDWLGRRFSFACKKYGIKITELSCPGFITDTSAANKFFDSRKRYFQTEFYVQQRKELGVLLEGNNEPAGGKWSFDEDNRKKYPAGRVPPPVHIPAGNNFTKEAAEYFQKYFPGNYGDAENFIYPVTFKAAKKWLMHFLEERFAGFGTYEDAIVINEHFLHHSVLSPLLNTGLLEPKYVLDTALNFAAENKIPLNSTEGFTRQIIGWREYIRMVYLREGRGQRTRNFWKFSRKLPSSFWKGTTGITPVDAVIKKLLKTGYCHHIERLMVIGNFMLLCEFDPDEMYRWFMEMFIDSYDWVMVPNVYGMVAFADGGLMVTKPYISGSNYILKMSDHKKGSWTEIWDALFWRFIIVHRDFFAGNARWKFMVANADKMTAEKRDHLMQKANDFLNATDTELAPQKFIQ